MTHSKTLIVYYSRQGENYMGGRIVQLKKGNTETVAEMIAELTGGDLFQVDTVADYPSDYTETTNVAKRELRDNVRPAIVNPPDNIDAYDVVYICFPNWWGTMPMAMWTFVDRYDWSGKTVLPLCTHEGSRMGRSEKDVKALCKGATVLKGLAIEGGHVGGAQKEISKWVTQGT